MGNKFEKLFSVYDCALSDEAVGRAVADILAAHFAENDHPDVYKQCLSQIDLTSLNGTDTTDDIRAMVRRVNTFRQHFPSLPDVAALCVYPALVPVVRETLAVQHVGIAAVAGGFPASQTFLEVKVAETAMTVLEGATEIDAVISVGKFLEGRYEEVFDELNEIKTSCREARLKVILETGELNTAANIMKASLLAMAAGADFIKTSTGKTCVSATPEATYVMCRAIGQWYKKNGVKVGFKAAGGISSTDEAVRHYTIVKEMLGTEWIDKRLFRFGATRLANKLLSSIEGKEVVYF